MTKVGLYLLICVTVLTNSIETKLHRHCKIIDKTAYCANKDIKSIPRFHVEDEIEILDVSGNDIDQLYNADFHGLTKLRYLYLNFSNIEYVEDDTLERLPNLEYLNLSNNILEDFPEDLIESNANMLVLDLSSNIFNVEAPVIRSKSLEVLDLSFNKIALFTEENVKGLPGLRVLNLKANNLEHLDAGIFSIPPYFLHVELHLNTWPCSCETIRLFQRLLESRVTDVGSPVPCMDRNKHIAYIFNRSGPIAEDYYCSGNGGAAVAEKKAIDSKSMVKEALPGLDNLLLAEADVRNDARQILNEIRTLELLLANEKLYFQELRKEKILVDNTAMLTMKVLISCVFVIGLGVGVLVAHFINRRRQVRRNRMILK